MANYDLIVIGGGPGGYVAALRGAQLGLSVACVEKEKRLGGTCLRVGCIPSKALLESSERYVEATQHLKEHGVVVGGVTLDLPAMLKRKDRIVRGLTQGVAGLLMKNGVTRYEGLGTLVGTGAEGTRVAVGDEELVGKHVILATGSSVSPLRGVDLDADWIGTSTEALSYAEVPSHLVVIGAGVIGLELGSVWARLGSKVTVLEYMNRILPGMDHELSAQAQRVFTKQGLTFELGARVTGARREGEGCVVEVEGREPLRCDRVLVAVGRKPNTEGLGLEAVGVATTQRGQIEVDDHFCTNVPGIYAIGDVIRGPMLAHKAEEEGVACVEQIVTGYGHVNYDAIPGIVYTHPEIAEVGKTEEQLKEAGIPYRVGKFPFLANGRARALGETEGFVKLLAHAETDRLLGAHVLGARAGDLIAELAVSIEFGASSEDVARASHAHPTLAEVVKEAALAVDGRALHV
ncbi:MAG: dihydrolipoyl dehydrogenase [Planctomycetes bacterium]|nr:dihydrolipoyl dehydrogenase [Planctomycetota bacterium]